MHIGEFSDRTGISPRALRHYEERGLLMPGRDANGYRRYAEADVLTALQIKAMIAAGLSAAVVGRYLDCAHTDAHGTSLQLCPALTAELAAIETLLSEREAEIGRRRGRLRALTS